MRLPTEPINRIDEPPLTGDTMTNALDFTGISHRKVNLGQIDVHVAELGTGPAVLFLHGFPSLWLTWRHQLAALAEADYRAIAPDQRGYGDTSVPSDVQAYDIEHLSGDVVRLLDALDLEQAVVVGHDWGAMVAWYTALIHPDRVRAVAGVSVPFVPHPRTAHSVLARDARPASK